MTGGKDEPPEDEPSKAGKREEPHGGERMDPGAGAPEDSGCYFYRAGKKIPLRRVSPEASSSIRAGRKDRSVRGRSRAAPQEAYVKPDGDPASFFIPTGQVVVQFAPDVEPARVERELAGRGGRVVRPLAYLPNGYLVEATGGEGSALRLANELHEQPFVIAAEPNWIRKTLPR